MAVKQDFQELEKMLDRWASALKSNENQAAKDIGREIQGYIDDDLKYKFKESLTAVMKKMDERYYW